MITLKELNLQMRIVGMIPHDDEFNPSEDYQTRVARLLERVLHKADYQPTIIHENMDFGDINALVRGGHIPLEDFSDLLPKLVFTPADLTTFFTEGNFLGCIGITNGFHTDHQGKLLGLQRYFEFDKLGVVLLNEVMSDKDAFIKESTNITINGYPGVFRSRLNARQTAKTTLAWILKNRLFILKTGVLLSREQENEPFKYFVQLAESIKI